MNCVEKSGVYDVSSNNLSTNKTVKDQIIKDGKKCLGYRHIMVFFGFWITFFPLSHRLTFSVAIVAMVNHTSSYHELRNSNSVCLTNTTLPSLSNVNTDGEFNWSSEIQGYMLGIHYFGLAIFNFLAGKMIEMWGEKKNLLLGNILGSILSIIIPFASWYHAYALIVVQFLKGAVEGVILPCLCGMFGKWFPRLERGLLSSVVLTAYALGPAFGGMFAGWICDLPQLGWPYVFYLTGAINLLIIVLIYPFYHERPENYPRISAYELNLILDGQETNSSKKTLPVPWKAIFTSGPVYAMLVGFFGVNWLVAYSHLLPTFMGTILHYGMTKNGIVSCFPQILRSISIILTSSFSTWLLKKNYVGVDKIRKGCNSIGLLLGSGCLLGVYLSKCDATANVIFFTFIFICIAITTNGSVITCVDMTPNFAGTLMGFVSGAASLAMFILPVIVGKMTAHEEFYLRLLMLLEEYACLVLEK